MAEAAKISVLPSGSSTRYQKVVLDIIASSMSGTHRILRGNSQSHELLTHQSARLDRGWS